MIAYGAGLVAPSCKTPTAKRVYRKLIVNTSNTRKDQQ
jgi:hypothetical protein